MKTTIQIFRLSLAACMVVLLSVAWSPVCAQAVKGIAIFGVGCTNISERSVRVVFTTLVPTKSVLELVSGDGITKRVEESTPSEIHRIDVDGLTGGMKYTVNIHVTAADGNTNDNNGFTFIAKSHPAQPDTYTGRTLFGVSNATRCDEAFMALGAGTTRIEASWDGIEPRRGQINQTYLSHLVDAVDRYHKAGISPVILLGYCNDWAQQYTNEQAKWRNINFGPPDTVEDWKHYVTTVMQALKGKAVYYEVWNEPDAGYLADGKPVERANVNGVATANNVFLNNNEYWIGDRYMPLVIATREVADEVDPQIKILGGSWNHDYHASRGAICFDRGMQNYVQQYCFHNYTGAPQSYARWEYSTDALYFTNMNKLFAKRQVSMPVAVSEYGMQTYNDANRPQNSGFSSRRDGQLFVIKSSFFYLSKASINILIYFTLTGTQAWNLVDLDANGQPIYYPAYYSYQWICKTFNNKPYRILPVTTDGGPTMRAYAVKLPEEDTTYLTCWQQSYDDTHNTIQALPARAISLELSGLDNGKYKVDVLDLTGKVLQSGMITINGAWHSKVTVPEVATQQESELILYRFVKQQ